MATPPGNGKTSPFGDGAGNVGSDQMATTGQPDPKYTKSRPQQVGSDPNIESGKPPGGTSVFADLDPKLDPGNPIGTVAGSGQRKPFRLNQG